ncbi:uncharacterized protein LOC131240213 isoform X2 [Magnolia sinica]|uniref:uncharacterized protein LOC131240213 isoform X2 n=1 Tax=Magnolia sinica TaxID=86752 RepID=UPI002658A63E|nr:uncharacterized protein LOC131240213 isoform X2 [Magnolia sinica]
MAKFANSPFLFFEAKSHISRLQINVRLGPKSPGEKGIGFLGEKMVKLFLSEPTPGDDGDGSPSKESISLLQKLESIICSVITSGGRSEARLWLCTTISCISSITHDQHELFIDLLRSKSQKLAIAAQVLQMIFNKRPQKVGSIIAKKGYMLEKFFEGNPERILQWFGNFAGVGESEHRKGARAISQFAFVNRDICWDELEWKGKHGQSPAMVATKPHYFLDLDVLRTVENFLENVPDFWSSDELAESLKDGEILNIDERFFIDQFVHLMYEDKSEDVWAVVYGFLAEEQFSFLCQHLLILLDEQMLHAFLSSLSKLLPPRPKCKDFSSPSYWLESLLSTCNDCASIDELLLLNAVINQGRQLLRLMDDDEHGEEKGKIEELLSESGMTLSDAGHWALMKACTKMKKAVAMKWLGLQSWVVHYSLSKECKTASACELLFIRNGISFRKSDDHSLVQPDGFSDGSGFDFDDGGSVRYGHKKKAKRKKRRKKNYSGDDSSGDELLELEMLSGWRGLQSGDFIVGNKDISSLF